MRAMLAGWPIQLLMIQKAYLNQLVSNKKYLENFHQGNLHITRDEIKIPFLGTLGPRDNPSPQPHQESMAEPVLHRQKSKNQYIIDHLSNKEKKRNKTRSRKSTIEDRDRGSVDNNEEDGQFKKSISLPMKTTDFLSKYFLAKRAAHEDPSRRPSLKMEELPKISLDGLQDQRGRKNKGESKEKSYIEKARAGVLRRCYEREPVEPSSRSMSRSGSQRRMKTEKDLGNEYMLQRLLTTKPTVELRRDVLIRKFELHRYYQRIRERKNINWVNSNSSMLRRSRSINSGKQFIKI